MNLKTERLKQFQELVNVLQLIYKNLTNTYCYVSSNTFKIFVISKRRLFRWGIPCIHIFEDTEDISYNIWWYWTWAWWLKIQGIRLVWRISWDCGGDSKRYILITSQQCLHILWMQFLLDANHSSWIIKRLWRLKKSSASFLPSLLCRSSNGWIL